MIVYLHPWELDPEQPRIRAGLGNTIRHRMITRRTMGFETMHKRIDTGCRRHMRRQANGHDVETEV